MHFLFISSWLGPIGGTETLLARMTNWLHDRGHKVTILANRVNQIEALFPKDINTIELGDEFSSLYFSHNAKRMWASLHIERPDVIKAFDLPASWAATVLSSVIAPAPKVVFGNYFPYFIPRSRNPLNSLRYRIFLLNLRQNYTDRSILFMSEEQISEFRLRYGHDRNPVFWPLPIENPNKNGLARNPQWGRIVSVGRLTTMKEYNLYMIDVVDRLRKKGYPVTWTVFGEGKFAVPMRDRINALGLSESIELKGNLSYEQFAEAMGNAYVFVGMGTSVIEAALCGVPAVVALAYDTTGVTYGPLYRFRFGNLGELMEAAPSRRVEDEIERVLTLREQDYDEEIELTRTYAKAYEIDGSMEKFMESVTEASAPKVSHLLFGCYYLYGILDWLRSKMKASD